MALEFRLVSPEVADALADLFAALREAGDESDFHPHPLDAETACVIAERATEDLYYVLVDEGEVLAYGMLRGWDEGYDVPSLGVAVRPDERGSGLGRLTMQLLHAAARRKGATSVRLTVYSSNDAALRLYRSLGYTFGDHGDGRLVGRVAL